MVADTPGFSSFDTERMELCRKEELAGRFREFAPYQDRCQFQDCAHVKEKGCAILAAVENGEIAKTRHESYVKLYESVKDLKEWELTKGGTR
jgi:ribosome biogenesis GTPase